MKTTQKKQQNPLKKSPLSSTVHPYVFITGASAGIGEATALKLAQKGHSLILTARRLDRLKTLQRKCMAYGAHDVLVYKLDVDRAGSMKPVLADLNKKKIKVKILINNAGLAKGVDLFQNSDTADWEQMLNTNVKGLLNVSQALISQIIETRGHVVNMGSVAGRLVYEGGAVYCATKFAVRAISDALRIDLKGTGVRVSNIEPGMVQTEFSKVRLGNQQKADAVYADMMPLSANDIAETILWCLNQPPHVNISELVIYPTDQATVGQVVRGEKSVKNLK
ncbi:MAG: SDR family NAD(P)-dependent oxidoreductase [Pseudobdellovibrio sp.]